MSKKNKIIIGVSAVVFIAVIVLVVILVMKKGEQDKTINIGKAGDELEEQSYWRTDSHGVAKAEEGYYFLETDNDKMTTVLKYFDNGTHKTIPVCAKAECMHNASTCDAVLERDYLSSQIHYYKGYIYVVRVDSGMAKLIRISKNGTNREEVAQLFANDGTTSVSLVFHDDCAYAYDHIGHTGAVESDKNDKEVIVKVDLSTGKTSEVFSYQGAYNAIYGARSFGDKLFFQIFNCSIDKATVEANINYQLYYYDYGTGETEKVTDKNISDYYVDTENGILYYFVIGKGLYSRKLNESESKLLFKADETMIMGTLSYDGKHIYMYNGGIGSVTKLREKIGAKIFVLEPDGTVVNTIELDNNILRNMYFGDENYLFFQYSDNLVYIDKKDILGNVKPISVE